MASPNDIDAEARFVCAILRVLSQLLDCHVQNVAYTTHDGVRPEGIQNLRTILELQAELDLLSNTAEIFGSDEFCNLLREYRSRPLREHTGSIAWSMQEREEARKLSNQLVIAAKLDLNPHA